MSFGAKTFLEAKARHKPLSRKTPLGRTGIKPKPFSLSKEEKGGQKQETRKRVPLQRRSRLKAGKKTKAWESERRRLKIRFAKAGITTCELRGVVEHECTDNDLLSFAHSTKRNDPRFNISEVIVACFSGHRILDEVMSHDQMYYTVKAVVQRREIKP